MNDDKIYVTINHLDVFDSMYRFKPGDVLTIRKDHDNPYDDEAIVAYGKHGNKCSYVANSVCTVARGTYSAGRAYDKIPEEVNCAVCFVTEENLICVLNKGRNMKNELE